MCAIGDKVLDSPIMATFAAFGSFALLLLVDFSGSMRDRLRAQGTPGSDVGRESLRRSATEPRTPIDLLGAAWISENAIINPARLTGARTVAMVLATPPTAPQMRRLTATTRMSRHDTTRRWP
jgi:hypothetical protein